ncbi:aspartyl protease family protein [Nonomuraea longicatena]|uniref:Tetratricopeptide repeat protein n=1 Tax=Nonomuraea longicatena TaxID=83682 RepID=A0ABN1QV78_9ACTN
MRNSSGLNRRRFLGLAAGVGVALPLLDTGGAHAASPSAGDPDKLFKDGHFKRAEHGYRRLLKENADNAHAAAQIGYIALLSNRFADAERFLRRAVALKPDDEFSLYQLADCFVRQDRLAAAVPWLRRRGELTGSQTDLAHAKLYETIQGTPWQVHGPQSTRIPFLGLEPLPHMEISVNGTAPRTFLLDTGATTAGLSMRLAKEAGLEVISESTGRADGQQFKMYYGIARSVRIGDLEVRNAPVHWNEADRPNLPDGTEAEGTIGTVHFYHFLTTMDYGHRQFVMRRRTAANRRAVRAEVARLKGETLPLWLAKDHFPCTLGSLDDFGPRVVTFDTGGPGRGIGTSVAFAERAGIEMGPPEPWKGGVGHRIAPERLSLGRATRRRVTGWAEENPRVGAGMKFDTIANFTHDFFKPFAITFDYDDMNLYITGDSMDPDTGR